MAYSDSVYNPKAAQADNVRRFNEEFAAATSTKTTADPLRAQRGLFIETLINARLTQRLTQVELGLKAGMTQSVIARIESGKSNPSLATLLKIAKALGVNLVLE